MSTSVHFSSKTNEWSTPQAFFDELNAKYHFTCDLAATAENTKCERYLADSLPVAWHKIEGWLWLNPPYGRELGVWVKKAHDEALMGAKIVMLIPARTDTSYWHDYIFGMAEVEFIRGRLKFGDSNNSAPFPSALVIFK